MVPLNSGSANLINTITSKNPALKREDKMSPFAKHLLFERFHPERKLVNALRDCNYFEVSSEFTGHSMEVADNPLAAEVFCCRFF
jgi:hypothetical protein